MVQTAYKSWDSLKMKLHRLGKIYPVCSKSYSALATLLLDTALKNSGYLPKESYYGSPFEKSGITYKEWITQLKRAGLIAPFKDEDQTSEKSDWIRFKPGPVTLVYVNKEKTHQHEIASMRDLHDGMQSVEDRIDKKKADRAELEETKMKLVATSVKLDETSSKLEETNAKLKETNRVIADIADAVRELQEAALPPHTPAKDELRAKATLKIAASVRAN